MNENECKNENKKNKELWIKNNIAMHKQYNYKNLKTCMIDETHSDLNPKTHLNPKF